MRRVWIGVVFVLVVGLFGVAQANSVYRESISPYTDIYTVTVRLSPTQTTQCVVATAAGGTGVGVAVDCDIERGVPK